jgi:alpha-galactosidase
MFVIENSYFRFTCNPEYGCFDLQPLNWPVPLLDSAKLGVAYRQDREGYASLSQTWQTFSGHETMAVDVHQGLLRQIEIESGADRQGVDVHIIFALAEDHPLFLWKISICNRGFQPVWIDQISMLNIGERLKAGKLGLPTRVEAQRAFYSQGWQSWNWTATYSADQPSRRTNLGLLEAPMYICQGTPQPRQPGHISSDFFGMLCDRSSRAGAVFGFLSQKQQFGSLEAWLKGETPALRMWAQGDGVCLDPGDRIETDWAVILTVDLDSPDPLVPFVEAVARENSITAAADFLSGWCSWYYYYQNITAKEVRKNLEALTGLQPRLPLSLVQIDDGFESQIGDWFDFQPGFPEGVAPLAAEIRRAGFTPGLWLAPFIVHPDSRLFKEHPEYILKDARGRPVNSGFNWNVTTTALDLTLPEALDYACRTVQTAVDEWGFPYLKLDFLYAGALPGRHRDPKLSRAQVFRKGLEALRQAAGPSTYLLGCGTPMGTSVGIFNAMRIGADMAGSWEPDYKGIKIFFRNEPHMPSVRNAIQNALTRSPFHPRWWANDPDCLILRPDTKLTPAEVQLFATVIGMTGGLLLVSDDIPALPPDRLRVAEVLLPGTGQSAQVIDLFDQVTPQRLKLDLEGPAGKWSVLAWLNLDDRQQDLVFHPQDYRLPEGSYWLRSFWDGKVYRNDPGKETKICGIPAHGPLLLAVRPATDRAVYLGSDLHFSQGLELAEWLENEKGVAFCLALTRECHGSIELALPVIPQHVWVDEVEIQPEILGKRLYRLPVTGKSRVRIIY